MSAIRFILTTVAALAAGGTMSVAQAAPAQVNLQNATATYTATAPGIPADLWVPAKTIDGVVSGSFTSWTPVRPYACDGGTNCVLAETIVWETVDDFAGGWVRFDLHHQERVAFRGDVSLGRFRLSFTTDDRSLFADGLATGGDVDANWTPIAPQSIQSTGGEIFSVLGDTSILVSGPVSFMPTYSIVATIGVPGVTGFRLEAMEDPSLPWNGPGRQAQAGNFHLSEFVVSIPEPTTHALLMAGLGALWLARRHRSH